jgi:DNA-directed RNA polymerase beta' subunit
MCEYKIPAKIELDYDFGYFLGAYCAEGCMTKHQISISNNDLDYLKPIQRLCEKFNVKTKIYRVEDKNGKGWVSQDIRIYNTVLCRIVENLSGKLSHNKFVSSKIVYSNRECIMGFLDAYIGGDGCVALSSSSKLPCAIDITSVSMKMLLDVSLMLKNIGVYGKLHKPKKQRTNNRGSQNIYQHYILSIRNQQLQKLALLLNLPIKEKQQRLQGLIERKFQYEYSKDYLTIPNIIDGITVFQPRDGMVPDLMFEEIVSIEEVSNTTNYAYDLTVSDTRNFDTYYGVACRDTFHLAGVASKSNVTRGVPRIEEILRLTKNPKNPSLTIHINDEDSQERATSYATMLEHTKLVNIVKSVQICFDPNENTSSIEKDRGLIEQYYEFEKIVEECNQSQEYNNTSISGGGGSLPVESMYKEKDVIQKSKWIIRMEFNAETMLDKNITMDDVHFAIQSAYGQEISCVYSDFNMENLVFRIRLNSDVLKKKKDKNSIQSLDQSDEIYLLKNFQDMLLNNIVLRGISGIKNVIPRKLQKMITKQDGKYIKKDTWILDTTGTNLLEALAVDYIDYKRSYSNDIREVFNVLGIEAARQVIYNEFVEVMEFSGVYINYHHLSLLCDRMTLTSDMVPIFRSGILNDDIGPLAKATFEVHTEVFLDAARHGEFDDMRGVSANVMCGQYGKYGTNMFNVILDMNEMVKLKEANIVLKDEKDEIEELFGYKSRSAGEDMCSKSQIEIHSNISTIRANGEEVCDDGYDMGF